MATCKPVSPLIKNALSLILIALTILCAASARILDEELPIPTPSTGLTGSVATPVANASPVATGSAATPVANASPAAASVAAPVVNAASASAVPAAAATSAAAVNVDSHHTLTFFMHDILGGSNPSARAVTGVVNNPAVNGQVPFAKANGAVLPVNNGVPASNNNGNINNNNLPFLTGLGGNTANVIVNNGNNINGAGFGIPVQNGGQLPDAATIQKLMFGTLTVIDDELTEGHELGSGLVGRAQGFYVASSIDGLSQTMAFTAMFEGGGYVDSITFFGVHRTAVSESQLAIMGGTGKYVNAQGFATVKTFPGTNLHNTDGVETLLEFTVYLAY